MGRRGASETDGDGSPWATDDIVAGPAPDFVWDQPDPPVADDPSRRDDPRRRNHVLVALGTVLVLGLGAIALWPGDEDPAESSDIADQPDTTLGTLPDSADGNEDDEPPSTSAADDETTEKTNDDLLASGSAEVVGDVTSIELPVGVAAIEDPTEIVINAAGELVTVSLPSGTVRRAGVSGSLGSGFVVGPDATAWFDGSAVKLLPRIGPALTVDLDTTPSSGGYLSDWVVDETGTTQFLVDVFDQNENRQVTVSTTGEVAEYEADTSRFDSFGFYGGFRASGGEAILNDAGGTYVISPDDTVSRISSGRALAANDGFVLLRECDESLVCGYLVHDRLTDERRPTPVTSDDLGRPFGFDLAPDGSATLAYDEGGQERTMVDLVDGGVVTGVGLTIGPERNTQWAPDSSGVFTPNPSGDGLLFIDRASGESVRFAAELGRVSGLGVRATDAELVESSNVVVSRPLEFSEAPTGPTGLNLVVLGDLGSMAHLDLDGRAAAVWSVPATPGSNAPDLFPVGDEVVVLPRGATGGFVSAFGSTTPLALPDDAEAPGYQRFPASEPTVVWSPRNGRTDGVDHQVVRIHSGGAPADLGGAVSLNNSELLGGDGQGRLVARIAGDVFVVAVIGTTKLTEGELLALGPDHALVRTCDDALQCSVDRLDRTTVTVSSPPSRSPALEDLFSFGRPVLEPGRSPLLSDTMSPDGTAAIVRVGESGEPGEWAMADFTTGGRIDLPSPANGQPIIWNADGSVAAFISDGDVVLVDRVAGRTSTLEGLGEVRSITDVDPSFSEATAPATGDSGATEATTL